METHRFPTPEQFVLAWERSNSITQVSVVLARWGYDVMTPRVVRRWGKTFREVGVHLKKISRPNLPGCVIS